MSTPRCFAILATLACLFALSCDREQAPSNEASADPVAPESTTAPATAPAETPESAKGAQVESVDTKALSALDAMDGREPVPLIPMMAQHQKQNMREHLVAVQEVVHAAAAKDFAAVEEAASGIGSSPQMTQMCNHMGAGAPGFTERALAFHEKADGIIEAARAEDADGVLSALDETLAACTSCHATYKQQVVSQAAWTDLTGQQAPAGGHH